MFASGGDYGWNCKQVVVKQIRISSANSELKCIICAKSSECFNRRRQALKHITYKISLQAVAGLPPP